MKHSFVVAFILLPVATWAQNTGPTCVGKGKASVHVATTPQSLEQALMGSANLRVLELASKTILYQHLSDTVGNKRVIPLNPGDFVVIRAVHPRWLVVCRAKSPTQFSADTTTYYISKAATKGSKTFIML